MDQESHLMANWQVGNPGSFASLEITCNGPELEFDHQGWLALCGADLTPRLNVQPLPMYRAVQYSPGDRLAFAGLRSGLRAYLAVQGGFDTPEVMGSRSTNLLAGIGGLRGVPLQAGDVLPVGLSTGRVRSCEIPEKFRRLLKPPFLVRVLAGPEAPSFSWQALRDFLTSPYWVDNDSNRIGLRLRGRALTRPQGADIISAGIPPGTVQVTGSGQLIVTMADGQTSGGYARLAFVLSADLSLLAQVKPGDYIRFREVRLIDAEKLCRAYRRAWDCFLKK